MKLISLNTWGGRAGKENFLKFIKKHKDVDIFCLQEIWSGGEHMAGKLAGGVVLGGIVFKLLDEIGDILVNHQIYFRPHYFDFYGLAVFIKKDIKLIEEGEIFVYRDRGYIDSEEVGNHARNIQWLTFGTKKGPRAVINFHGLWNGLGKNDSYDRLLQSDNIIEFMKNLSAPHVLCGDFNLRPDTKSIKKLEEFGLRNLIVENGISSTRTELYTKTSEKFADYIFVDKKIKVHDFKVLPDVVSDHLAMYLDFE